MADHIGVAIVGVRTVHLHWGPRCRRRVEKLGVGEGAARRVVWLAIALHPITDCCCYLSSSSSAFSLPVHSSLLVSTATRIQIIRKCKARRREVFTHVAALLARGQRLESCIVEEATPPHDTGTKSSWISLLAPCHLANIAKRVLPRSREHQHENVSP